MEGHYGSPQGKATHAERSLVHRESLTETCMLTGSSAAAFTRAAVVENILTVKSDVEHSRMRRVLTHAFSEKAMREQEPLIQEYVDLLMNSLHETAEEGPQNMVSWYNFVAFDIIGMQQVISS